jgi:class 3 adenylate cyclase
LATVRFTDIVDSTKQAAEISDWKWGELLQQHEVIVRRELERFRGREVNTAGDDGTVDDAATSRSHHMASLPVEL